MTRYPHTTWQQKRWSPASRRWVRIVGGLGLLLGLVAIFGHTLLAPFARPQVHVFVLSGEVPSDVWPEVLPSLRPVPAAATLFPLVRLWTDAARLPAPHGVAGLATGQTLDDLIQTAESPPIRPGDVVIGMVQSQLATIDGTLFLVDRLNPRDPQRGRVPFDKFLEAFRTSNAGTKLLCLDAGQLSADPRSGMSINNFGEPLRQIVERTGDPQLWVLISHRPGQQSQVAEGRPPTVFLDAVTRGLRRDANHNADQQISLGELVHFVQQEAAGELRTGAIVPTQTPWLLRGKGAWTAHDLDVVLAPVPRSVKPTTVAATAGIPPTTAAPEVPAAKTADVAPTVAAPPVTAMTVPELLTAAWELRDQLEQIVPNSSFAPGVLPRDFAPCSWNTFLAELIQAEALWRSQPDAFPPRIHVLLQVRVQDLRGLAGANSDTGSKWLKNIQQLKPCPVGELHAAVSLSMHEQWQRWAQHPASESTVAERTTLQTLLAATDSQAFRQWVETKPTNLHAELQFAGRLSQSGQEWPPIQQALQVRTLADELACQPVAVKWFAADLLRGDRLRWYGERKLSDPVRAADSVTASQSLREAGAIYQQVAAATERIAAALRLEADLLADLPHWMTLSRNHTLAIRASLSAEMLPLMADLEQFIELLTNVRAADCGRIEQLRHSLQTRRDRIATLLFPEDLLAQFAQTETPAAELRCLAAALLETPLPTAGQRSVFQQWPTRATTSMAVAPLAMVPFDDHPGEPLAPDQALESRFARLLQPLRWTPDVEGASSGCWAFPPISIADQEDTETASWCQRYISLPGELRKHLETASPAHHDHIIAWRHALPLIDPRDELPFPVEHQLTALSLGDMQRVVQWQCQQATLAQADASAPEFARLQEQVDGLNTLLTNTFGGSRPAVSKSTVRISSPEVVDLAAAPEQMLRLTVQNSQRTATRVRYVVDYDPALLDVASATAHCQLASQVPRADHHLAPYEALPPALPMHTLSADGQDELRLQLRGHLSEGPARLVVHVVTDHASLRQDIVVNLPPRPLAAVQIMATANMRQVVADQQLRPFGNRSTAYHFAVQGLRRDNATLDITAYRVTASTTSWPTATTLPTVDFQRWLSQTAALHEVASLTGVGVKTDVALPLRFPAVKPEANATLDVSGGLLIVMHDAARQLTTWQHLPCSPLRPAAYLDASVDKDLSRETLNIAVRPRDELELPAEGIPVRCRIVKRTDQTASVPSRWESAPASSVTGLLQPHLREFTLNVPWPQASDPAVVLIDVDGWPRAFVFQVEPSGVRPVDDFAIEILDPQRRSAVRAPAPVIPVTVAVTIPTRLLSGENLVEVGIDRNSDRRLDGEPIQRLATDRQTEVVLESIDPAGFWTLGTKVRDWQIMIPSAGLSDQWGTVLARIARGPHEVWSEGTPVVFDQQGPRLSQVNIAGNGELAVGQPVRITALADDQGLSGVGGVSAGIDPTGLGIIGPNTVMVPAKADGEEVWSVTLPTEKLTPGPYVVVLQATDLVGNTGPVSVVPIRYLTAEEVAARSAVSLQGQVQYSGEAIGDAEVRLVPVPPKEPAAGAVIAQTLTTKTNRRGQFAFDAVAPGPYELTATGTVRGFRYESRTPVTVAPGKLAPPVQVVFGQKVR